MGSIKSTENYYRQNLQNALRTFTALTELVDNSIDGNATSIEIETREGSLKYSDNGTGIKKGLGNALNLDPDLNRPNRIGNFGAGLTSAVCSLSDWGDNRDVEMFSETVDERQRATVYFDPVMGDTEAVQVTLRNKQTKKNKTGFELSIPKLSSKINITEDKSAMEVIYSPTYIGKEEAGMDFKIKFNQHDLYFKDILYLNHPEVHLKDTLRISKNGKQYSFDFGIIDLDKIENEDRLPFDKEEAEEVKGEDGNINSRSGLYIMLNGRLTSHKGDGFFPYLNDNQTSRNRFRCYLDLRNNSEAYSILGIKSDKSNPDIDWSTWSNSIMTPIKSLYSRAGLNVKTATKKSKVNSRLNAVEVINRALENMQAPFNEYRLEVEYKKLGKERKEMYLHDLNTATNTITVTFNLSNNIVDRGIYTKPGPMFHSILGYLFYDCIRYYSEISNIQRPTQYFMSKILKVYHNIEE